jgi:hypothetical protein
MFEEIITVYEAHKCAMWKNAELLLQNQEVHLVTTGLKGLRSSLIVREGRYHQAAWFNCNLETPISKLSGWFLI